MSVDTLPPTGDSLDRLYRDHRAELYRALVLITANRDVATEAIDRGYRSWHQRIRRTGGHRPQVEVLSRAVRWARRRMRRGHGDVQGFRLPGPELTSGDRRIVERFSSLPLDQRIVVVLALALRWSDDETASALRAERTAVDALRAQALTTIADGATLDPGDVAAALGRATEGLSEPLSRYESVRAAGTARRLGTLVGAAVLTAGVIGGGVMALGGPTEAPPEDAGVAAGSFGEAVATGAIDWTQIRLPIKEGETRAVAHGPGGFVVLANDWSQGPGTQVFTSQDGVTWLPAGSLMENRDGWVQSLAATDDGYVAVGNIFDNRNGREQAAVWTSPDAVAWTRLDLDIGDSVEIDGRTYDLHTWVGSVSVTDTSITVLASQNAEFDVTPLLREQLDDFDWEQGYGWSDQGIELYNDQGRLTQRIPWSELDIDQELVRLVTSGRHLLFTSPDGVDWSSRVLDSGGSTGHVGGVAVIGDTIAALVYGQRGAAVWSGPLDGEWARADVPDLAMAHSVVNVANALVVVGATADGGGAAWISTDGAMWERVDSDLLDGSLYGAVSGTGGIAAFGDAGVTGVPVGPVPIPVGDGRLEVTTAGMYTLFDAAGTEIISVPVEDLEYDGGDILIVDPESGETLATVQQAEVDAAFEDMFHRFEGFGPGPRPERYVVFSDDGRSWSRVELAEMAASFYPNGVAVGNDVIVLTGFQDGGGGFLFDDGPPAPVLWVGTLG